MSPATAPTLEPNLGTLNSERPLCLEAMRGRVVVLHFFNSGSALSWQGVQAMQAVDRHFSGRPLEIVGVHTGKFSAETRGATVAAALQRLGVAYPVVLDKDMAIWARFGVRVWPSIFIVAADGSLSISSAGELNREALITTIESELRAADSATLPWPRNPLSVAPSPTVFRYPGKLAVDPNGRLAVSDPGHHRVVGIDATGQILFRIGSGVKGHRDGAFFEAELNMPHAVAWDDESLWLTDLGSHTVRRADLRTGQLATIVGTGELGQVPLGSWRRGTDAALRSPSALAVEDGRVFVSLAGGNQVAVIDKERGEIAMLAGSGREDLVDGTLAQSAFAQPSGLFLFGRTLYVVDAQASAIRGVRLDRARVETVVGRGLFDFGAADGPLAHAQLQYPQDVVVARDGSLIIADTYNDRLRRVDLNLDRVSTFYRSEGDNALRAPHGLALAMDGSYWIADSGNHRVVRLDPQGKASVLNVRELGSSGRSARNLAAARASIRD